MVDLVSGKGSRDFEIEMDEKTTKEVSEYLKELRGRKFHVTQKVEGIPPKNIPESRVINYSGKMVHTRDSYGIEYVTHEDNLRAVE